jgi:hypothetical protein
MAALPVDALRVLPPRTLVRLQGVAQRRGRPRAHLLPPSVRGLLLNYIVDHCAGLVLCDIEWWSGGAPRRARRWTVLAPVRFSH